MVPSSFDPLRGFPEARRTAATLKAALEELKGLTPKQLIDQRYEKFRHMAAFFSRELPWGTTTVAEVVRVTQDEV